MPKSLTWLIVAIALLCPTGCIGNKPKPIDGQAILASGYMVPFYVIPADGMHDLLLIPDTQTRVWQFDNTATLFPGGYFLIEKESLKWLMKEAAENARRKVGG